VSEIEKRASDLEREGAVARLRDASTEGRLTFDELADRTALAYRATTSVELERLTSDLPDVPARTPSRSRRRWLVSLVVPLSRSGRRALGERNVVVALFAPVHLDLREAHLQEGEASVTVFSLFAPISVNVPEHVDVDSSVLGLLAPARETVSGDVPPHAPRLRIRGIAFCGPVLVQSLR
jgi:hypothetical protein